MKLHNTRRAAEPSRVIEFVDPGDAEKAQCCDLCPAATVQCLVEDLHRLSRAVAELADVEVDTGCAGPQMPPSSRDSAQLDDVLELDERQDAVEDLIRQFADSISPSSVLLLLFLFFSMLCCSSLWPYCCSLFSCR